MLKRFGPRLRFVLGMTTLIVLLGVTAALWWWLPARSRAILSSQRGTCEFILVAPNGQSLAAIHDKTLAVWDLAQGRELGVTTFEELPGLWFSPDGQTLTIYEPTPGSLLRIRLWQPAVHPAPGRLPGLHRPTGMRDDFTPGSGFFITGARHIDGNHSKCLLWEVASLRERPFPIPIHFLDDMCLLNERRIVLCDGEEEEGWLVDLRSTTVWNLNADLTPASEPVHLPGLFDARVSSDGRLCAARQVACDESGEIIRLVDLKTGRGLDSIPGKLPVQFNHDGTRLITDLDYLWDITVSPPRRLGGKEGQRLEFSPDGKWLRAWSCLTGPTDTMAFFDAATFTKQPMPSDISDLTFGPDSKTIAGKRMVAPSAFQEWMAYVIPGHAKPKAEGALHVWALPGWQVVASFPHAHSFAYLPDGQSMSVGYEDGTIRIWDIPPRRPWYIDYGLPVLFALLVLLGARLVWRAFRKPVA